MNSDNESIPAEDSDEEIFSENLLDDVNTLSGLKEEDINDDNDQDDEDDNDENITILHNIIDNELNNLHTKKILTKYERVSILIYRVEQLNSGSMPFIKNYKLYNNSYDIAVEELNQNKIPFIIKRKLNNNIELVRLSDINVL